VQNFITLELPEKFKKNLAYQQGDITSFGTGTDRIMNHNGPDPGKNLMLHTKTIVNYWAGSGHKMIKK
jgi:hypothetical protein